MIKIGVFAKTFQRETTGEVLQAVRQAGFDLAHFNFASVGMEDMPEYIAPQIIEQIKFATHNTGVALVGISATFNMAHPDSQVRMEGLRKLEKIAGACPELEIPLISLCSGSRNTKDKWASHPDNNTPEAWKDMVTTIEKAILTAEKYDVYLGVEPELENVINSPLKAFQLITEMQTDRIKIILDPANLFEKATKEEIKSIIYSALDLLHPFIGMAHAKDRTIDGQFIAPGQGIIPFDFYINCLNEGNLNIPLVAHGFSESEAATVSKHLKSLG